VRDRRYSHAPTRVARYRGLYGLRAGDPFLFMLGECHDLPPLETSAWCHDLTFPSTSSFLDHRPTGIPKRSFLTPASLVVISVGTSVQGNCYSSWAAAPSAVLTFSLNEGNH
jgi:hypothetical protein